jgi:protein-S-isoprenylcysteine O-methyltransferase Ste14
MRPPPPLLALAAGVAQRALTPDAPPPSAARRAVAGVVSLASMVLAGAASAQFFRRGTTVEPFRPEEASVLVTTGANSITRNPMYVGMAGVLVANAIRRGSLRALAPAAGFVFVIDRFQIAAEEAALRKNFGEEYAAYNAAVPRWLGRPQTPRSGERHADTPHAGREQR